MGVPQQLAHGGPLCIRQTVIVLGALEEAVDEVAEASTGGCGQLLLPPLHKVELCGWAKPERGAREGGPR